MLEARCLMGSGCVVEDREKVSMVWRGREIIPRGGRVFTVEALIACEGKRMVVVSNHDNRGRIVAKCVGEIDSQFTYMKAMIHARDRLVINRQRKRSCDVHGHPFILR
jgi:hypothetical protein